MLGAQGGCCAGARTRFGGAQLRFSPFFPGSNLALWEGGPAQAGLVQASLHGGMPIPSLVLWHPEESPRCGLLHSWLQMYGIGRLYRRTQEASRRYLGKEKRRQWSETWRKGFRLPGRVCKAVTSAPHLDQVPPKSYSTVVANMGLQVGAWQQGLRGVQRNHGPWPGWGGLLGVQQSLGAGGVGRGLHSLPSRSFSPSLLPALARA